MAIILNNFIDNKISQKSKITTSNNNKKKNKYL